MAASTSERASSSDGNEAMATTVPKRVRAQERAYKSEMMFIGQRCHWHECHREDFLPFRCADCHETFCSEHFRTQQHACPTPTPTFVVPLCPLCHEPPSQWKRDEDPNVAMDAHLTPDARSGTVECAAIATDGTLRPADGKGGRKKRDNECNERRCRKLMVVPIRCPSCSLHFCPSHRAPVQHQCDSTRAPEAGSSSSEKQTPRAQSNKQSPGMKLLDSLAAKRVTAAPASHANREGAGEASTLSAKSDKINPVKAINTASSHRKMDKRAKNEQSSAIKAMQDRHKRGLLSPAEQVKLAEEMAKTQASGERRKEKDCTVM